MGGLATHWGWAKWPCQPVQSAPLAMWDSFLRKVCWVPFHPVSLWDRICLPNKARPTGQMTWPFQPPGSLVPSALVPRAGPGWLWGGGTGGPDLESPTPLQPPVSPTVGVGAAAGHRQPALARREVLEEVWCFPELQVQGHLSPQMPFTHFNDPQAYKPL